ncbi:MAG: restriction endonuclease subunit S [Acetobacteraceae bacterium]|nr:restriction endonuclease subunit S [Acetobacteraceae bacterium]
MRSTYPIRLVADVLTLQYGKPLPDCDRDPEGKVPAYGANGVLCWTNKAFRRKPSIIVGRKGSAGEVHLTNGAFWPTDVTYFVEHDERDTDLRYLFYLVKFLGLQTLAKGVKPGINRNEVYGLQAPIPPVAEQRRIVAILDEVFEGIASVSDNMEKNISNTRELFDTYLDSIFIRRGANWHKVKLETVCGLQNGFAFKSALFRPSGVPIVRISNIQNGRIEMEEVVYCDPEDYRENLSRYRIFKGDLLIAMSGATTGKVGFNYHDDTFYLKSTGRQVRTRGKAEQALPLLLSIDQS